MRKLHHQNQKRTCIFEGEKKRSAIIRRGDEGGGGGRWKLQGPWLEGRKTMVLEVAAYPVVARRSERGGGLVHLQAEQVRSSETKFEI